PRPAPPAADNPLFDESIGSKLESAGIPAEGLPVAATAPEAPAAPDTANRVEALAALPARNSGPLSTPVTPLILLAAVALGTVAGRRLILARSRT
ncbi:MAG: hypothetical protein ACRDV9_15260, partial [Acidimicrobiia bacterium]